MSAPENPPAFPCTGEGYASPKYTQKGMTLRDWFAGQAMSEGIDWVNRQQTGGYAEAAAVAYEFADAMLAAREAQL